MTPAQKVAATVVSLAIGVAIGFALLLHQIDRAPETYPWGNAATTSIYAMRAARGNLAVGAYSRFQWNHPGPLLYELLAPLYALSGYREISIKWTTLILNVSTLAGVIIVLRRRAPVLACTVGVALLPLLYREQRLLFWAWNPIVPLLPLALMIALSAEIAVAGSLTALPLVCAVVSLIIQAHVGFVPVVGAVSIAATVLWGSLPRSRAPVQDARTGRVLDAARSSLGRLRPVFLSVLVLAVLWAAPIAHELTTRPGNLISLAQFFQEAERESRPWWTMFVLFANQFVGPFAPAWELTTAEASEAVSWPVLLLAAAPFVLLPLVSVRAFRRRALYEGVFALLCLSASCAGLYAIRSIVGPVSDYLIIWIVIVGALSLSVIAAEAIDVVRPSIRGRWSLRPSFVAAYLVVMAVMGATRLMAKQAADSHSTIMRKLTVDLDAYCRKSAIDRPLLSFTPAAWEGATGVLLQYYKQRWPIAVPDESLYLVGDPFKATGHEPAEFYLMKEDEKLMPPGIVRFDWLTTFGSYRLVRLYRIS